MKVDEFDFALPRELIAERPAEPRDAARLLVVRPDRLEDRVVRELPALLEPGDLLVVNDTRVIPARLRGRRGEARIEVTLFEPAGESTWRVLARPAKRLRAGDRIDFAPDFSAAVMGRGEGGEVLLAFDRGGAALMAVLEAHGEMPLPPYIRRPGGADEHDRADYQTVYARVPGAVAAPTAGLHFTPALLEALDAAGVRRATVTLHVGAGTFLPMRGDDVAAHRIHAERGEITAATAAAINDARTEGGRLVAVGTTTLRLLESAADPDGRIRPFAGDTELFILPGHRFRSADLLMTNFHLPRSTLFMLVCAFSGTARMRAAYAHAVASEYRFYSYGDASLLERGA